MNLDKFFCMFVYRGYASAMIVHTWADQLLLQLLMDKFDTLLLQYRHIGHLHEEVFDAKFIIDKMVGGIK